MATARYSRPFPFIMWPSIETLKLVYSDLCSERKYMVKYLKWFFPGEDSVADFTFDAAWWTRTLVDKVSNDVGTGSTPFTIVTTFLTRKISEISVRGQVQTVWGLKWCKSVMAGWRIDPFLGIQVDGPEGGPTRGPRAHPVNVWRWKDGIGWGREQISSLPSWCRHFFCGRHRFNFFYFLVLLILFNNYYYYCCCSKNRVHCCMGTPQIIF